MTPKRWYTDPIARPYVPFLQAHMELLSAHWNALRDDDHPNRKATA